MEKDKKRILMVHNYYQLAGGEDRVLQNEAELLRQHGHDVFFYTRDNSEIKQYGKLKKIRLAMDTVFSFKTYFEIKRLIGSRRIDIVHVHNTLPLISYSVYYAARKCGVPVIQTVHNFRYLCPNGCFYREDKVCELCRKKGYLNAVRYKCYRDSRSESALIAFMLWFHRKIGTYKKVSAFIALTDFNKKILEDITDKKKICVKPNFAAPPGQIKEIGFQDYYLYAGRLEKEKGLLILASAFKQMPEKTLLVIGSGHLDSILKEFITKNHLKNIKFLGSKSPDEVKSYMAHALATIVPSQWYEGFGLVVVESFSVGTPVIGANIGNIRNLVEENHAGVVFDYHSPKDLCKKINLYGAQAELRKEYQKNAAKAYFEKYEPKKNYEELIYIYETAISNME